MIRFTATQYVDIFVAAGFAAAAFFALRWLREPRWGDAVLAGAGLGLAAGAKVLGIPYALALAATTAAARPGRLEAARAADRRGAVALLALLGGHFYAPERELRAPDRSRARCEGTVPARPQDRLPHIPRINTVAAWMLESSQGAGSSTPPRTSS